MKENLTGGIIEAYTTKVKDIMNKYGEQLIVDAEVSRTPIWGSLKKILYLISRGKSVQIHDEYFHLNIIFTLQSGTKILVEKNQTINMEINVFPEITKETTYMKVPNIRKKKLNINTIMERTRQRMGNETFFRYSPLQYNCQDFILNILRANNLTNPNLEKFLYQDMKKLIEAVPSWVQKIGQIVFDLANYVSYIKVGKKEI